MDQALNGPGFDYNPGKKAGFFLGADEDGDEGYFDGKTKQDKQDDETIKKIEDFKKKYQEMKDKAEENEKELAYSTIKVEELVSKIKEVEYNFIN